MHVAPYCCIGPDHNEPTLRCAALRCAFTWAAPNCGVLLPTAVLDWTRWHHRVHCGGVWSLQEELQLTSRLRKELAELRATGVGY